MKLTGSCLSDVGRVRGRNEDSAGYFPERGVFVVADGMGGHLGGKEASESAVRAVAAVVEGGAAGPASVDELVRAVERANLDIHDRAAAEPSLRGMGTTLVAIVFESDTSASLVHVGDSRAYRLRDERFEQLTGDHSLVADLVRQGEISADDAKHHPYRHTLTRAIGVQTDVSPEVQRVDVRPGDLYVLASDGAYGLVSEDELAAIVVSHASDPEALCRAVVDAANAAGGKDNSTVIAVRCEP